ncbi:MAG: exo-alpha-sialidase [Armatimonadetes bacterium]|nr:exo-alpha-sialidase [Armatimonadota bacterium]
MAAVLLGGGGRQAGGAIAVLRTADFHALAFSPDDPEVAFFGHHNGMMRSTDGGRTWSPLVAQPNFDAMGLAVNRGNSRQIFLAGHDVFQISVDGGASWQPVAHDLPGTDIHGFAMSSNDPNRLYAFVVRHGLFSSADGGRRWTEASSALPGDVMALAAAGGSPEILYAGSMRAGVLKSTDGGRTWEVTTGGLPSPTVFTLAIDPTNRNAIYAGLLGGLFKSTDGGTTWSKLPFPGENVVALAVSPSRPNVLLAITVHQSDGLVYRSEDGGQTWGQR